MTRRHALLRRGLVATAPLWPPLRTASGWVHDAARGRGTADDGAAAAGHRACAALSTDLARAQPRGGTRAPAVAHCRKVTVSYGPHLVHTSAVPGLPRTTNDLDHCFGSARYHERRATGRKFAAPGTVVRGAVRLVAAVATRQQVVAATRRRPAALPAWRARRAELDHRHHARRWQFRFRRDSAAYLAQLEAVLLKPTLPS